MPVPVDPNTLVNGVTADAGEVEAKFDVLFAYLNGNVDEDALAAGAVGTAELKAAAVTLAKLAADVRPIGEICAYAGATPPSSAWLLCEGQVVSRTLYNALFLVIGTAYNTGGEAGTDFRLPDLRGRVPVGPDGAAARLSSADALGNAGGAESHTNPIGTDGSHTHNSFAAAPGTRTGALNWGPGANGSEHVAYTNHGHSISMDPNGSHHHGGATGLGSSLQPYQVVSFIIRAQ